MVEGQCEIAWKSLENGLEDGLKSLSRASKGLFGGYRDDGPAIAGRHAGLAARGDVGAHAHADLHRAQ